MPSDPFGPPANQSPAHSPWPGGIYADRLPSRGDLRVVPPLLLGLAAIAEASNRLGLAGQAMPWVVGFSSALACLLLPWVGFSGSAGRHRWWHLTLTLIGLLAFGLPVAANLFSEFQLRFSLETTADPTAKAISQQWNVAWLVAGLAATPASILLLAWSRRRRTRDHKLA